METKTIIVDLDDFHPYFDPNMECIDGILQEVSKVLYTLHEIGQDKDDVHEAAVKASQIAHAILSESCKNILMMTSDVLKPTGIILQRGGLS